MVALGVMIAANNSRGVSILGSTGWSWMISVSGGGSSNRGGGKTDLVWVGVLSSRDIVEVGSLMAFMILALEVMGASICVGSL